MMIELIAVWLNSIAVPNFFSPSSFGFPQEHPSHWDWQTATSDGHPLLGSGTHLRPWVTKLYPPHGLAVNFRELLLDVAQVTGLNSPWTTT